MSKIDVDELQVGRELDALVAEKVMGWTRISWDGAMCAPGSSTERRIWRLCSPEQAARLLESLEYRLAVESDLPAKKHWRDDIPNFSTDIATAWQVVERLGSRIALQGPDTYDISEEYEHYKEWQAVFFGDSVQLCNGAISVWPRGIGAGQASTAPLAICRAALKVVMDES